MLTKIYKILQNRVFNYIVLIVSLFAVFSHWLRFLITDYCINNSGIALGTFSSFNPIIPLITIGIILLILLFYTIKNRDLLLLALFLAGLSNWLDRLIDGFVCDYILFLSFYINLNDIIISTVVILISLRDIVKDEIKKKD